MTTKLKVPANKEIEAIALLLAKGDKIESRTLTDNDKNVLLICELKEYFNGSKYPDYFALISGVKSFDWNYNITGNNVDVVLNNYDCAKLNESLNLAQKKLIDKMYLGNLDRFTPYITSVRYGCMGPC